jgi:hypothetical protein
MQCGNRIYNREQADVKFENFTTAELEQKVNKKPIGLRQG